MATTFHPFLRLPRELRDHIWTLAVRPAVPGVHLFRAYDVKDSTSEGREHETTREIICDADYPIRLRELLDAPRLAAPQCIAKNNILFWPEEQAKEPISWTRNNPSTYLTDSGLWTACKESQLAVRTEFLHSTRRRAQWSPEELSSFLEGRGLFTLPEVVTFAASDGGSRRYFTVFPDQDLFILQPPQCLPSLPWNMVWDSIPSYKCLEGKWNQIHKHDPQVSEVRRHIALEYDPCWDHAAVPTTDEPEQAALMFIESLVLLACQTPFNFWFIDYRIHRNFEDEWSTDDESDEEVSNDEGEIKVKQGENGRDAFLGSNCRFVEVKTSELKVEDDLNFTDDFKLQPWHGGYVHKDKREGPFWNYSCADEFVQKLNDYAAEASTRFPPSANFPIVKFGLLACEYLQETSEDV
ncbi:hypothetical protein OQA88_11034 [Cercophora sp. LCS_1]